MRLTEEQPSLLGYCKDCGMPVFIVNGDVRWQECEISGEFCQVDPLKDYWQTTDLDGIVLPR